MADLFTVPRPAVSRVLECREVLRDGELAGLTDGLDDTRPLPDVACHDQLLTSRRRVVR